MLKQHLPSQDEDPNSIRNQEKFQRIIINWQTKAQRMPRKTTIIYREAMMLLFYSVFVQRFPHRPRAQIVLHRQRHSNKECHETSSCEEGVAVTPSKNVGMVSIPCAYFFQPACWLVAPSTNSLETKQNGKLSQLCNMKFCFEGGLCEAFAQVTNQWACPSLSLLQIKDELCASAHWPEGFPKPVGLTSQSIKFIL